MTKLVPASPQLAARWRAEEERRLPADEFEARIRAPMTDDERALIAWFQRRYPTPAARLAAHRRRELERRRQRRG